jgi:hypothetical protein
MMTMPDELSSDQAASLRGVIAHEKHMVAWYKHLLGITEPGALATRLASLMAYHKAQVKRRQKELKK